ncbi:acyl-CoA dehydrogenase family protein [Roseateles violae]|uniref:Acyl-CoA dehydrogenase n=1 Tax=Roseateles violae TaxID=3058042 RepID=A0ABT8DT60_9BURK|nr:acyl-CoA dehydrogenase [Pelomonas sp. PFR6]MDN3921485.1 acyl-CoA dehydrogenase [Pelomonas sp. PFR6]
MTKPNCLRLAADAQQVRAHWNAASEIQDRLARKLASGCAAPAGGLDPSRLDQWQLPLYELACCSADLAATQAVLDRLPAAKPLDQWLGLSFAIEAITQSLARLEALLLEFDEPIAPLQQLGGAPEWVRLRGAYLGSAALAELGQAVLQLELDLSDLGMPVSSPHLAMVQDSFRRFAAQELRPLAEAIHRQDRTVPESLLQPLREMGVFGLSVPNQYGGYGQEGEEGAIAMLLVTEALSEASLAAGGSLITRPEILARVLMAGGTEEQKQRWLPAIAQGEPLCAIAITEPDAGSDVAALSLRASKVAGGWLLQGAKSWCTFAGKAGLLMVVARTDADRASAHRGLSVFLVEKPSVEGHAFEVRQDGAGRLSGRAIPTIGYRGMHSFELAFDRFFVPDSHLVGGPAGLGKGFAFTMTGMIGGRLQTAARACGVMKAALQAACSYARDRSVFGAPLANYPLTQAKIARMAARLAACRILAFSVAARPGAEGDRVGASQAKLLACRSAETVTREALQIHGAMGYAEESAVSRYFVDARVLSIFEGAEETLALKVIARGLLEAALRKSAALA